MRLDTPRALVLAIAVAYGAICWTLLPAGPFTAPDTRDYLEMRPIVPLGYPAFLALVGADAALPLQIAVFSVALAALGLQVFAAAGSLALTVIVLAGVIAVPGLRDSHATLLTESLFTSGLLGFLAAIAAVVRAPSSRGLLLASLIAGVTATVRRTSYAFLPILLVAALAPASRRRCGLARAVAAGLVPALAVLAVENLASRAIHGSDATSLTGRHLFAKAALISPPPMHPAPATAHAGLRAALENDYAPLRALIAAAPPDIRASLTLYYETCLQGPCVAHLRDSLAPLSDAAKDAQLAEAAARWIGAAPGQYVQLTLRHYLSLWTAHKTAHPATAATLEAFLAAQRPLPFEREAFKVGPETAIRFVPNPAVRVIQPAMLVVGAGTAVLAIYGCLAVLRGRAGPALAVAALSAATAHAALAFSAAAAAGITRFMLAVLPAVLVAAIMGSWLVAEGLRRRVAGGWGARYH